jgi:peptide deformylase
MFETMYDAPGIGLAAPQIGVLFQIFVMDCASKEEKPNPLVFINPVINWASTENFTHNEGCLSIPEQYEDITRPANIKVSFQNLEVRNLSSHYRVLRLHVFNMKLTI